MNAHNSEILDRRAEEVAYLLSHGWSERKIADHYGLDVATIARAKKLAIERRLLVERPPAFDSQALSPDRLRALEAIEGADEVRKLLGKQQEARGVDDRHRLRAVAVFDSGSHGTDSASWRNRLSRFGNVAADELRRPLGRGTRVGVTWGQTLASVCAALKPTIVVPRPHDHGDVVAALCGEPFASPGTGVSSSTLGEILNEALGNPNPALTLRGVAALIPDRFKREAVLDFVRHHHVGYGKIFGQPVPEATTPLVLQLDTVLTSAGTFDQSGSMFNGELMKHCNLSIAELKELSYGDIGGLLLPRELSRQRLKRFDVIAGMWTGMSRMQLQAVVERAGGSRNSGVPGVVLVALGSNKAEIVLQSILAGLVNELFIDHDLATQLRQLLGR